MRCGAKMSLAPSDQQGYPPSSQESPILQPLQQQPQQQPPNQQLTDSIIQTSYYQCMGWIPQVDHHPLVSQSEPQATNQGSQEREAPSPSPMSQGLPPDPSQVLPMFDPSRPPPGFPPGPPPFQPGMPPPSFPQFPPIGEQDPSRPSTCRCRHHSLVSHRLI
ncbi:hypothetical protein BSL78_22839 [Apostichopus japonicus]|uniref:Uncharacterized protein n=1 Tax=Stichopus japonicus TaxID=307972 RepID=A0A2G8JWZ8_STIJA|nr:hypothetical protein BSL78_22839 [Apostichopus japonicus]